MSSNRRFSVGVAVIALGLGLLLLAPAAQAIRVLLGHFYQLGLPGRQRHLVDIEFL